MAASVHLFQGNDEAGFMRASQLESGLIQRTDTTNADRLVKQFGDLIRYNPAWKKWLCWNGKFWETDEGEIRINEYVKMMVRGIYRDMLDTSDYRERLEIEKFAVSSESMRRINACISLASKRPEIRITSDDLDIDPMLLNLENGTLDFSSNTFREHSKSDYITKIARVNYDINAACHVWENFIREIMNYKPALIVFLQTAAGLGVTGVTREQVMFILYGSGANGKSTFLNTILNLLGDYAVSTQTETFLKQNADKISNDIARLRGTRFVTTTETEQGKKLAEPLIKQITGNDKLTARFLFSEYFSFLPAFKIYMATNHKPLIRGTDYGIWRRIRLIPFTTTIPAEKQDKDLEDKLKAEWSGILNWLAEGVVRWRAEGLKTPDEITSATDEYRSEMDVIGNFIKEQCIQNPAGQIRIRELFRDYQNWCADNNEHACSERFFSMRLKEMGYKQIRTSEARYWAGILLRPSSP
jgi:putative DNA primase/helicase